MKWDDVMIFLMILGLFGLTYQRQQDEIYHPMSERIQQWEAEEKYLPVLSFPEFEFLG